MLSRVHGQLFSMRISVILSSIKMSNKVVKSPANRLNVLKRSTLKLYNKIASKLAAKITMYYSANI